MAWLEGWNKRVKLTIDEGDIDADLSNFPILVYISSSSGYNAEDVSFIFDEVGANSQKIAFTSDDGTTELYAEIETWDSANEKAWIWVKVTSISGTVNTDIYMYYDNTHADNVAYIGTAPTDAATKNVWNGNYICVMHMKDITTSTIQDSTTVDKTGTKKGANEPASIAAIINTGQDHDGTDDFITIPHNDILNVDVVTLEAWVKMDTGGWRAIVHKLQGSVLNYWRYGMGIYPSNDKGGILFRIFISVYKEVYSAFIMSLGVWYHVVATYDGATMKIFFNAVQDNNTTSTTGNIADNTQSLLIGKTDKAEYFDGIIDEVRVSNVARNSAWIKATYETGTDHLLDWGTEETLLVGFGSGSVIPMLEGMGLI